METLLTAFAPAFAAAIGLQQLLEILDPVFAWLKERKGVVLKPLSWLAGLALAIFAKLRVLHSLGYSGAPIWDIGVTSLIISGGTEGFNSIIKFLGYTKEKKSIEVHEVREASGNGR